MGVAYRCQAEGLLVGKDDIGELELSIGLTCDSCGFWHWHEFRATICWVEAIEFVVGMFGKVNLCFKADGLLGF